MPETYQGVTERLIKEIKEISEGTRIKLKPKILELASHFEVGLDENRPEIIAKIRTTLAKIDSERDPNSYRSSSELKPEKKHIAKLIIRLKEENFPSIAKSWIYAVLPDKYKEPFTKQVKDSMIYSDEITDKNLYLIKDELLNRIKRINQGASKEIKIKNTRDSVENSIYTCPVAEELKELLRKMENEHETEHKGELCKELGFRIRTARDHRFATDQTRYEALVVTVNAVRSLGKVVEDEQTFLTRWEINDNEKGCTECRFDLANCRAKNCKCVCHEVIKTMTTKGLKFAIKNNPRLRELDETMRRLMSDDYNDMCPFSKLLLKNAAMDRHLDEKDKKGIILRHIQKDECIHCEMFVEKKPDFFKDISP